VSVQFISTSLCGVQTDGTHTEETTMPNRIRGTQDGDTIYGTAEDDVVRGLGGTT
jgi:hypothetical protein